MPTTYPGATDAFTNPAGSDPTTSPDHAEQHTNANDAIEALETYAPRGVLGYAQVVASQGSFTSTELDITGLSVAVTVAAGRRIRITAMVEFFADTVSHRAGVYIKEGATYLHRGDVHLPIANGGGVLMTSVVLTPSAGAHTYKLSGQRTTGGGTVTMFAAAERPAYILVEDIGSA